MRQRGSELRVWSGVSDTRVLPACLPHLPPFMSLSPTCRDVCRSGVVLLPSCMQADGFATAAAARYCCLQAGHARESVLLLLSERTEEASGLELVFYSSSTIYSTLLRG